MLKRNMENLPEVHAGNGSKGRFILGDARDQLRALQNTYVGRIKLIYLDPPFMTGDQFSMRVRVGAADWKASRSSMTAEAFSDAMTRDEYLSMMRDVLTRCHALLRADGMLFLHIDYRTHPYLRLMMDEIFGEDNFLNEIIWVYQTGGRTLRHFSRKHDVILFYRKSAQYDFNVQEVMAPPTSPRSNHMRRHVDPDGRVYRSIKSGGRVYTYYDDDPVAPTDVWNDLSHLQQRDPERTGYDTQKPLSLLERIVKCGSRAGEIVLDPFSGSGTTLEAAKRCGRDFIGVDQSRITMNILRRRLSGADYRIECADAADTAECRADAHAGVGFYHVDLHIFRPESTPDDRTFDALDVIDNWSVGYIRGGKYHVYEEFFRSRKTPELQTTLNAPVYSGQLAMCVNDVYGRRYLFEIDPE